MITIAKTLLRQFRKYPVFSLINIGGLAVGIAASFILLIYAQRELSTDKHFKDADHIARICTDFFHLGPLSFSQAMLPGVLKAGCKDVQDVTALRSGNGMEVRTSVNDRAYTDNNYYQIDSSFF